MLITMFLLVLITNGLHGADALTNLFHTFSKNKQKSLHFLDVITNYLVSLQHTPRNRYHEKDCYFTICLLRISLLGKC